MIMNIIIAIVILQIGTFLGVAFMTLMTVAKDPEPKKPKLQNPEKKETTKLWMVNNLCKWNGEIYEIRSLVDRDGQTGACLLSPDADDAVTETIGGVLVPIEELEEVE